MMIKHLLDMAAAIGAVGVGAIKPHRVRTTYHRGSTDYPLLTLCGVRKTKSARTTTVKARVTCQVCVRLKYGKAK